jgi:hypothetical protein
MWDNMDIILICIKMNMKCIKNCKWKRFWRHRLGWKDTIGAEEDVRSGVYSNGARWEPVMAPSGLCIESFGSIEVRVIS